MIAGRDCRRGGRSCGCAASPRPRGQWAVVAGSLAAITGFLVAGLTEFNFGDSEVVLVAWCVMALPFVVDPESPAGAGEASA
ncbi:MAG TPA: hypothetical protein VEH80_05280 [Candidatus Bathyarchaeia archaeon]|nr:hypothetical protein [Candidatus Bathyarchaeia archaeon]